MKGLIIKSPWIDKILYGEKTWEIRGSDAKTRSRIALIKSGTGTVVGTVELHDSLRLCYRDFVENSSKHCINNEDMYFVYNQPFAWFMRNPVKFDKPIPYKHPQGAVIWVNLDNETESMVTQAESEVHHETT